MIRKKRWSALILIGVLILVIVSSRLFEKRILYPIHYMNDIQVSAKNYQLDPYLIAAIIRVESNYKSELVSKKGAIGLMQIMPDTADWIVQQAGFSSSSLEILDQPDVNIELGSWYIHALMRQFQDKPYAMIAAYNAGPGNVQKWIQTQRWDGTAQTINQIPFGETRHYIQRVVYYYKKYLKLYAPPSSGIIK